MTIPDERLRQIVNRFAELEARMASGQLEGDEFVAASRDYAELEPVAQTARAVQDMRAEIDGLTDMLADPEMKAMAAEELAALNAVFARRGTLARARDAAARRVPMRAPPCWKFARARAVTRRLCSRRTFTGCTRNSLPNRGGRSNRSA